MTSGDSQILSLKKKDLELTSNTGSVEFLTIPPLLKIGAKQGGWRLPDRAKSQKGTKQGGNGEGGMARNSTDRIAEQYSSEYTWCRVLGTQKK